MHQTTSNPPHHPQNHAPAHLPYCSASPGPDPPFWWSLVGSLGMPPLPTLLAPSLQTRPATTWCLSVAQKAGAHDARRHLAPASCIPFWSIRLQELAVHLAPPRVPPEAKKVTDHAASLSLPQLSRSLLVVVVVASARLPRCSKEREREKGKTQATHRRARPRSFLSPSHPLALCF